jgi:hypothetical protein
MIAGIMVDAEIEEKMSVTIVKTKEIAAKIAGIADTNPYLFL